MTKLDRVPLYERVANDIRAEIKSGAISPGVRIASVSEIRNRWEVSMATAQKAMERLRADGYIERAGNRQAGHIVSDPSRRDRLRYRIAVEIPIGVDPNELFYAIAALVEGWQSRIPDRDWETLINGYPVPADERQR